MASRKKHEVIDLLQALRAEGIVCSTVSVGAVTLDGITWLASDEKPVKPEPRQSMWEQQAEAIRKMPAAPKDDVPPETYVE